jgi:hypothetical protein
MEKEKKQDNGEVNLKRIVVIKERPRQLPESHEWYPSVFQAAKIIEAKFGPMAALEFKLTGGKFTGGESAKGYIAKAFVGLELTPTSKLMSYVTVMNGGNPIDIGDEIDLTAYYGEKFDVFIELKERPDRKGVVATRDSITKIAAYGSKCRSGAGEDAEAKKVKKVKKVKKL